MDDFAILPPPRWRPTDATAAQALLAQLDCFAGVPAAEIARIAGMCTLRAWEPGATLTVEHSVPHMLFIVVHGSVSLLHEDAHGDDTLLTLLGRGDVCGEGGLFGLRARRTSTRAETRVVALQLLYAELHPLLDELPAFRKHLKRRFRERLLQTTLAHVPLFSSLNAIERLALSVELEQQHWSQGALIVQQGATDSAIGIIAEGQAEVRREGRTINLLGPGDVFGEITLLNGGPHTAAMVALTPVHVLTIPLATFRHLLQSHPLIAEGLQELVKRRYSPPSTQHTAALNVAITSGVARGQQVLARVPALCPPDCTLCERGCASRWGAPRLRLHGVAIGALDTLRSCKHCDWGPECVAACPTNAIQPTDDGFLTVTDACVGCGACAEACPYDAITMIPLYTPVSGPLDWLRRRIAPPAPLRLHANKCDGCAGHTDHACITACPTGSLRWITLRDALEA